MALRVNLIQVIQFVKLASEIYHANNEVWMRSLERRNDGSVIVLLKRFSAISDYSNCGLEFQDVTEQYLAKDFQTLSVSLLVNYTQSRSGIIYVRKIAMEKTLRQSTSLSWVKLLQRCI